MKRYLLAFSIFAAAVPAVASDVGVTIGFDQPGVYGRIDIGRAPSPPVLVYPQPVVIAPSPVAVYRQPIYLHVPPGHAKKWSKHCAKYNACGQPVYFVQDRWYRDVYRPVYHSHSHEYDKYERKREKEYDKYERKREKEMRKREKEWHKQEKRHHKKHHHDD
ncbi:hypothetical protein [Piscinibacter sakaiensis]|uniref:hypothetical protein n=1 Tax=Piscinibacter sakaiensis TaxID=1547922 RepID=UPI003AAF8552